MEMRPGLSDSEVAQRLSRYGFNELPGGDKKNIWVIVVEVIREPMFILLISSSLLYMLLGDYREGLMLLSFILVIIFITFYQYQKTERALEKLKNLSSPRAKVIRNQQVVRIPGREVVPGDILSLAEGDRVPADARLLEINHVFVDESMLTGESIAVQKMLNASEEIGMVFSGTMLVQGRALAEVTETGVYTQLGKIGTSLSNLHTEETRLQVEMKKLIRSLLWIGVGISLAVFLAFYLTRGGLVKSILNALSTSIAILPEEFPVVFTVFLAIGAWRLSKIHVLTRNPSAIETLGSTTVLCSDKTGTITQNRMQIMQLYSQGQLVDEADFKQEKAKLEPLIHAAELASHASSLDPMELAIFQTRHSLGVEVSPSLSLVHEYPLSTDLLAMTQVYQMDNGIQVGYSKGAPEAILNLCRLSADERALLGEVLEKMASMALRVIAVGKTDDLVGDFPVNQRDMKYQFLGLIGLQDPIRPEVPLAIQECFHAGITVKMITGDYPKTATSIAKQIGLRNADHVLSGEELLQLSDEALKNCIGEYSVFARIKPEQKLRIVNALKQNNEVVAMTGDGVNDAPALKAAHIGIAMGNKGTDVAREASSLVLLDDNFASIVAAIRSGRRIFDNLQKAMSYIISIHIPIIGLTLLPAMFEFMPLLLLPLHIVFLEMIIDPICSVAFESEVEERAIMSRPPRDVRTTFFGFKLLFRSIVRGLLLLSTVLVVFWFSWKEGHSDNEIRAISFSALIIGNIFFIYSSLSNTRSFIHVFIERNAMALFVSITAILVLLAIVYVPYLQSLFSFEFPGFGHFRLVLLSSISLLVVLELVKWGRNKL
ncbi:cation-translocating P-type ATPase [Cytophagaceae bacterium 50C-KIRBA]|uniref:Cation-translocating P-type ATPase n=1 Tax=Aquirufa beregesia TaxID=2516556 RepID=A0ABX0EZC8_9BACT|nr:cation-translocating P-type ATPase [Aquirufa beregesia]NGZ44631.1 cation-translocating P-type ATPase [Aquirufa beregesia]